MPFSPDEYVTDPVLKVLIDADALLPDESKWWQLGIRKNGTAADTNCIITAVWKVAEYGKEHEAHKVLERALGVNNVLLLAAFNDDPETEFPDIKALFAKAIAAQQEAVYSKVTR